MYVCLYVCLYVCVFECKASHRLICTSLLHMLYYISQLLFTSTLIGFGSSPLTNGILMTVAGRGTSRVKVHFFFFVYRKFIFSLSG